MASAQELKINCGVPNSVSTILSAALCTSHLQYCTCLYVSSLSGSSGARFNALHSLALFEWWHEHCKHLCARCCTTTFDSVIVSPQLKLIVMDRKEGTAINLQLRTASTWSQCALSELPEHKIRNVLNVLVCQILFFFV